MVVVRTRVKRIGGSIHLAVPPRDAQALGLREGDIVPVVVVSEDLVGFGAYPDLEPALLNEEEDEADAD